MASKTATRNVSTSTQPKADLKKRGCIIYCRVSSGGQNNNNSVSLSAQKAICLKLARRMNLNIKRTHEDVHSAYKSTSPTLQTSLNNGPIIIFYDVSRFCRSIDKGMQLAAAAVKKGKTIIFCHENLVIHKMSTDDKWAQLKKSLSLSELESKRIARRITSSRTEMAKEGRFIGGAVPYGYKVELREEKKFLIPNTHEQYIKKFIRMCKTPPTSTARLNELMGFISATPESKMVPIKCFDKDGEEIDELTDHLNIGEIRDLLNDYNVLKRGRKWSTGMVGSVSLDESLMDSLGTMSVGDIEFPADELAIMKGERSSAGTILSSIPSEITSIDSLMDDIIEEGMRDEDKGDEKSEMKISEEGTELTDSDRQLISSGKTSASKRSSSKKSTRSKGQKHVVSKPKSKITPGKRQKRADNIDDVQMDSSSDSSQLPVHAPRRKQVPPETTSPVEEEEPVQPKRKSKKYKHVEVESSPYKNKKKKKAKVANDSSDDEDDMEISQFKEYMQFQKFQKFAKIMKYRKKYKKHDSDTESD